MRLCMFGPWITYGYVPRTTSKALKTLNVRFLIIVMGDGPAVRLDGSAGSVDGRHIHAVLAHTVSLREVDVRNDALAALKIDEAKPAPLAALADLEREKASDLLRLRERLGDAMQRGGLADPRPSSQQQDTGRGGRAHCCHARQQSKSENMNIEF